MGESSAPAEYKRSFLMLDFWLTSEMEMKSPKFLSQLTKVYWRKWKFLTGWFYLLLTPQEGLLLMDSPYSLLLMVYVLVIVRFGQEVGIIGIQCRRKIIPSSYDYTFLTSINL